MLLPQWFKPYLGCKKKSYCALGMVVPNLGFPLPQPPSPSFPVLECRGELKAQKVKKNHRLRWEQLTGNSNEVKKLIKSNNINNKSVQKKANHMPNAHHSAHYPYWKRSLLPGTDCLPPAPGGTEEPLGSGSSPPGSCKH